MLTYRPGDTVAHRLDPRSKFAVQIGFAIAAVAHTTPRGLLVLSVIAGTALSAASASPIAVLRDLKPVLALLVAAPILEALEFGAPWVSIDAAVGPSLAAYRVLLILFVSAAVVRTTPARHARAAVQHTVPGRPGQLIAVGVAAVFRFLPLLRGDLARVRDAVRARLGTERPPHARVRIVAVAGVNRAFERADGYALALRARCFAWNPTLPVLAFGRHDLPALAFAALLVLWGAAGTLSGSTPYAGA